MQQGTYCPFLNGNKCTFAKNNIKQTQKTKYVGYFSTGKESSGSVVLLSQYAVDSVASTVVLSKSLISEMSTLESTPEIFSLWV